MTWKELSEFIEGVNTKLHKEYDSKLSSSEYMLSHFIKLSEEVGELAEQVLAYNDLQRSTKNMSKDKVALGDEIADVLFTLLLLAKDLDVDIDDALIHKMKKVKERLHV